MGGYGSGGSNRTHKTIEDYKRISSFDFQLWLHGDQYLAYKEWACYEDAIMYYPQDNITEIKAGTEFIDLKLSALKSIDGKTRQLYFICPYCGARRRYLYNVDGYYECRGCMNGNYKIQQKNGLKKLSLQMERLVEKELRYTRWRYDYPDTSIAELPYVPRPRYMRRRQYEKLMQELRDLQSEYVVLEIHSLMNIIPSDLKTEYSKIGIK